MDEEQVLEAENAVELETTETESPAVEEQTTQEEEQSQEGQTEEEQPQESGRKRNAQSRLRELLAENKALKSGGVPYEASPIGPSKFSDLVKGKEEVTPEDLDAAGDMYAAQKANTLVDLKLAPIIEKLQRQELKTGIDQVQSRYEELNPDSDNYDAELDKTIANMYAKYGAGAPLTDFVEEQMTLAGRVANKQTSRTAHAVEKQSDDQVIRPGQPREDTPFEELSIAEMEKRLGLVR